MSPRTDSPPGPSSVRELVFASLLSPHVPARQSIHPAILQPPPPPFFSRSSLLPPTGLDEVIASSGSPAGFDLDIETRMTAQREVADLLVEQASYIWMDGWMDGLVGWLMD